MSYFVTIVKGSPIGSYIRKKKINKRLLNKERISKAVDKHCGQLPIEEKQAIINDVIDMARKYRFSVDEYFYYHFRGKTEDERKTFISDANRMEVCIKMNKFKNIDIFADKSNTARVFSKYYKRDFCEVRGLEHLNELKAFAEKHKRFIVKPIRGSGGSGVRIVENDLTNNGLKDLISELCEKKRYGFMAEEIIVQVPEMAQLHPSSLNTVRLATVRFDEGIEVINGFWRSGRGGSIVDNAGAGGVFGTMDITNGHVDAAGDEDGNIYVTHPNTGIDLQSFVIPRWDEAVALAKELATVVPDNRYTGWDLALTENGWVMVEGNCWGQFLWQIPRQKGYMSEIEAILKRLGIPMLKKLSV